MELIKIINARKVLDSFSDKEEISAHLAYWMTKFVVKTEADHSFYASEAQKIFNKYAESEGGELVVTSEKISAFKAELAALERTEAEDPGIRFDLTELSSELKLSMRQMYPLLDFINEDK